MARKSYDVLLKELREKQAAEEEKEAKIRQARALLREEERTVLARQRRDLQQTVGELADEAGLLAYPGAVLSQEFLLLAKRLDVQAMTEQSAPDVDEKETP